MNHLEELDLSFNKVSHFLYNGSDLLNLKILKLKGNRLQTFFVQLNLFPKIQYIDLSENIIKFLPRIFYAMVNIINLQITVNLQNNSLICDCERIEWLTWLLEGKNNIVEFSNMPQYICLYGHTSRQLLTINIQTLKDSCNSSLSTLKHSGYHSTKLKWIMVSSSALVLLLTTVFILTTTFYWKRKLKFYALGFKRQRRNFPTRKRTMYMMHMLFITLT